MTKKPLILSENKVVFLTNNGFTKTYEGHAMEKWEKGERYHLTIHFSEKGPNQCELLTDKNNTEPDVFSERNLLSELKKRLEIYIG